MFDGPVSMNIGNICEGAVPERFARQVQKILANIADPMTDSEGKRTLTITFKFTPTPDRKAAAVSFTCKSALLEDEPVTGSVFISKGHAYTEDPRQAALFAQEKPATPSAQ